ncbi:RNA helicase required for poly(A+) mRNA export [Allomyces javanicus]|nr:RNA helicase required for poly(A+) mRNA export [Allomyces javanicus]
MSSIAWDALDEDDDDIPFADVDEGIPAPRPPPGMAPALVPVPVPAQHAVPAAAVAVDAPDASTDAPDALDHDMHLEPTGLHETFFDKDEIVVTLANRDDPNSPLYSVSRFEDLGLTPELLRGLYGMNFTKPSKIQERALPLLLRDPPTNLIAQSQSGTGKTAAFALTMLSRIDWSIAPTKPQALCLVNTRELAVQIEDVVKQMGVHTPVQVAMAVKDAHGRGQKVIGHVVVGTPGTVLELARRRQLDLSGIKVLVLDEADTMLDAQNLGEQAGRVRPLVPSTAQVLLFSATFPDKVKAFAASFAPSANLLSLAPQDIKVDAIRQFCIRVPSRAAKFDTLSDLYGLLTVGQSIIFVHTRATAVDLTARMQAEGHQVAVLTGELTPAQRDRVMAEFRSGSAKVLIATNVLSRGIDVPQVNLVVNYDLPMDENRQPDFEAYVHRIGRTGRFGRAGVAINLIDSGHALKMQQQITAAYGMAVTEMPRDYDVMERLLRQIRV